MGEAPSPEQSPEMHGMTSLSPPPRRGSRQISVLPLEVEEGQARAGEEGEVPGSATKDREEARGEVALESRAELKLKLSSVNGNGNGWADGTDGEAVDDVAEDVDDDAVGDVDTAKASPVDAFSSEPLSLSPKQMPMELEDVGA